MEALKMCEWVEETKSWICQDSYYAKAGRALIHCNRDLVDCRDDLELAYGDNALDKASFNIELTKWHRQWQLTIPLGIFIGIASSAILYFSLTGS